MIVEIGFALHGWPGLARYMFEAGGMLTVLAGVCVGRLLVDRPRWPRVPSWAGSLLVGVLVLSLVPAAISHAGVEHKDLREQRKRTAVINDLTRVIDSLGGPARLRACGEPLTRLEYQTTLAYALRLNVNRIGFKYSQAIAHGNPIVLFTPPAPAASAGWCRRCTRPAPAVSASRLPCRRPARQRPAAPGRPRRSWSAPRTARPRPR